MELPTSASECLGEEAAVLDSGGVEGDNNQYGSDRSTSSAQHHINGAPLSQDKADNLTKTDKIKKIIEDSISTESRQKVLGILDQVNHLTTAEKLLLYLKLPTNNPKQPVDPLRQPLNPLGSRFEIQQTITWIKTHLEEDGDVSLPKQDVYEEYITYCNNNTMKPLSTADFGKVMKQVFPSVRPRRLGTRGNSRYCYAGMKKRQRLQPPLLPDLSTDLKVNDNEVMSATSSLIREWAEKLLDIKFNNLQDLACHLVEKMCVDSRSGAAFTLLAALEPVPKDSVPSSPTLSSASKHRDTQLQLQRKLQEREAIKEQKRKHLELQEHTTEEVSPSKLKRLPPQQDEYVDYTSVSLPTVASTSVDTIEPDTKVPIPRLKPKQPSLPPVHSPKKLNKYKPIQPKSFVFPKNISAKKKRDGPNNVSLLSRRLAGAKKEVSSLEKDAFDDYLHGGGNSQEQEEELMQYFQHPNNAEETDDKSTVKLSQLRLLLEKNLTSSHSASQSLSILSQRRQANNRRVSFENSPSVPPSPNTRRRIFSFTPISPGPQSPLGRGSIPSSANASPFVSPGNTPVPRSVRNYHHALPRPYINPPQPVINPKKFQRSNSVNSDLPYSNTKPYYPSAQQQQHRLVQNEVNNNDVFIMPQVSASAPQSPMMMPQGSNFLLEEMLRAKPIVDPLLLNHTQTLPMKPDPLAQEVSQFFPDNLINNNSVTTNFAAMQYRSQSVPLHRMGLTPTPVPSEYTDFDLLDPEQTDPEQTLNSENLNRIFTLLDAQEGIMPIKLEADNSATDITLLDGYAPNMYKPTFEYAPPVVDAVGARRNISVLLDYIDELPTLLPDNVTQLEQQVDQL